MSKDKSIDNHKKHIDNFFKGYLQEQFSAKDYRLMNWVYRTKELRNEELNDLNISKQDSHEDIYFEEVKQNNCYDASSQNDEISNNCHLSPFDIQNQ